MMSLQGLRSTKELVNDVRCENWSTYIQWVFLYSRDHQSWCDLGVTICNRRQALDQAGAPADFKFKHHRPVDIEKIKTSKYYSGPIQRAQLANLTVSTPSCCL